MGTEIDLAAQEVEDPQVACLLLGLFLGDCSLDQSVRAWCTAMQLFLQGPQGLCLPAVRRTVLVCLMQPAPQLFTGSLHGHERSC